MGGSMKKILMILIVFVIILSGCNDETLIIESTRPSYPNPSESADIIIKSNGIPVINKTEFSDYFENIVNKPDIMYNDQTNRMNEYINYISKYKEDGVKIGLELDIKCNGKLVLRDEHADSFDMFLGAIHYIPESFTDIDKGYLWNLDLFCDYKVDILAHPFRIYKKLQHQRPTHLYNRVAKSLQKHGIAAELNFHTNEPDWEFFKICIENGVKIAFGSDAHVLHEVCAFGKNIEMLSCIYKGNMEDVLFDYQ